MQPGGGRGGRTLLAGVHRLIALLILQLFMDIRGQRRLAQLIQHRLHGAFTFKFNDPPAVVGHIQDMPDQLIPAKIDRGAGL